MHSFFLSFLCSQSHLLCSLFWYSHPCLRQVETHPLSPRRNFFSSFVLTLPHLGNIYFFFFFSSFLFLFSFQIFFSFYFLFFLPFIILFGYVEGARVYCLKNNKPMKGAFESHNSLTLNTSTLELNSLSFLFCRYYTTERCYILYIALCRYFIVLDKIPLRTIRNMMLVDFNRCINVSFPSERE